MMHSVYDKVEYLHYQAVNNFIFGSIIVMTVLSITTLTAIEFHDMPKSFNSCRWVEWFNSTKLNFWYDVISLAVIFFDMAYMVTGLSSLYYVTSKLIHDQHGIGMDK